MTRPSEVLSAALRDASGELKRLLAIPPGERRASPAAAELAAALSAAGREGEVFTELDRRAIANDLDPDHYRATLLRDAILRARATDALERWAAGQVGTAPSA